MTNHELQANCFSEDFCLDLAISRSSSVDSLAPSDNDSDEKKGSFTIDTLPSTYRSMLKKLEFLSRETNARVSELIEARSGKLKQRWAVDPHTGQYLRLVAGCIPILNDSRIILVGSSSGKDWLVPKGGWESDEELEEGAIRECFEEAGVLGVLGPKFDSFCVETRKAKQLRLESSMDNLEHDSEGPADIRIQANAKAHLTNVCDLSSWVATTHGPTRTTSLTHTHVCMTFFPLYVQAIHDSWPEDKRTRQAFTIDGTYP